MEVVRATALSNYPGLVTELGGDPTQLMRTAGIRAQDIGKYDVFVPLVSVIHAVEAAAQATGTVDFGRRLARRQGIEILGPLGVAARTASTVGGAFAIFSTYMAAYSPALSIGVVPVRDRPERSFLEFRLGLQRLPPCPQSIELSLGVILKVMRFLLGAQRFPMSVHLPHKPLTAESDYRDYFGCQTRFGATVAGFTLRTAYLDCPLDHDEIAHQTIVEYLATLIGPTKSGISQSVCTMVRQLLPTGAINLEVVAAQFNVHPKTLQRRLAAEGTTFFALVDGVRRDAAEHYLRDTDIDLAHLSHELGYTEHSALTRSCKRWFGTGPAAYRRVMRAEQNRTESGFE